MQVEIESVFPTTASIHHFDWNWVHISKSFDERKFPAARRTRVFVPSRLGYNQLSFPALRSSGFLRRSPQVYGIWSLSPRRVPCRVPMSSLLQFISVRIPGRPILNDFIERVFSTNLSGSVEGQFHTIVSCPSTIRLTYKFFGLIGYDDLTIS